MSKKSQKFNPDLDNASKFTWITLVLLIVIALFMFKGVKGFIEVGSGDAPWYLIIVISMIGVPFIACLALWIVPLFYFARCQKHAIAIPIRLQIGEIVNLILIIAIITTFALSFTIKDKYAMARVDQKLSELYPQGYEILGSCNNSNEGGSNNSLVAVKLNDYAYPFVAHFNWNPSSDEEVYEDTLQNLQSGELIPYRKIIKEIFGNQADSLMIILEPGESSSYRNLRNQSAEQETAILILILPATTRNNINELREKLNALDREISEVANTDNIHIDVNLIESASGKNQAQNISLNNTYHYCTFDDNVTSSGLKQFTMYEILK